MPAGARRAVLLLIGLAIVVASTACSGVSKKQYEYEEEIYLFLDGTATVNVNASVASLAALRGADLPVDPTARVDRRKVRALFEGPGATVTRVSLSRRHGRRFVHVGMNVADIRALARLRPFSWSTYQLDRQGDVFVYKQTVGAPSGTPIGDVGWTGDEIVMFRMHIPSEITFHNTPTHRVERGNILEWEQPLSARRQGVPVDLQVTMEPETILYTTLLLFGGTVVGAAFTFGVVLWFVWRKGARETHVNAEG